MWTLLDEDWLLCYILFSLSLFMLVSSAAVIWVPLVGEKRCVTTQITAAEETMFMLASKKNKTLMQKAGIPTTNSIEISNN